ncbi:MAG TPA: S41 family peptidase [Gemmatimonadales bacterium]|nr:S41 family peptidase [Gemmatimonadales bacterium]
MRRPWLAAVLLCAAGLGAGAWFLGRAARVEQSEPTRLFQQVLAYVRRYGVDSLPEGELYRRAADGLLRQLDDEFATLLPEGASLAPEDDDLGGLGMLLSTRDGRVEVIGVLPGSPAARVGLRPGDVLVEVDGLVLDPARRDLLMEALEGPPGGIVGVRVRRPGITPSATFELARERSRVISVSPAVLLDDGIGYVAVQLPGRGAAEAVEEAVTGLAAQGGRRLILDLRGASGGDLGEAADIAGLFLEPGNLVATVRGKGPEGREVRSRRGPSFPDLPVVVLVDGLTADGAEAIAGALQDHDRALVVGQPTFGRGFSRESFVLATGLAIRMSTESWHTPAGRPIPRDTAFGRDSLEQRARVPSFGGRELLGGGGIVPDSVLQTDSLSEGERAFLRSVGSSLAALSAATREVAADLARSTGPGDDFQPGPEAVDRVLAQLTDNGVTVEAELVPWARSYLTAELGRAVVAISAGPAAVVRRDAGTDPAIRTAVELLRKAASARALVFGGAEER